MAALVLMALRALMAAPALMVSRDLTVALDLMVSPARTATRGLMEVQDHEVKLV